MGSSTPLVYVVLGTPGAGRRAVVRDLVENGLEPAVRARVLLAEGEAADPADEPLGRLSHVEVRRWRWAGPGFPAGAARGVDCTFLLADPRVSVVDQLEALKPWLAEEGAELGRVYTVVDCGLVEKTPALLPWFDACIHFSDVVFFAHREGVANKWLSGFTARYTGQFFPCHFIPLKKKELENPALVLDPTPRRVSQYFDESEELPDVEIESDDEDEEENEDAPVEDPYFARMRGGRRVKEVPDLRAHLPAG